MSEYDQTLGTLLVGIFFNTYLYGIVSYQFGAYYRADFNDMFAIKCMVAFLFALDTLHSAAVIYMAWYYLVTNYGQPSALAYGVWPYPFTPIGTACTALITHLFLSYRIWRLTNTKFLSGIIVAMAIPTFALGIVCGVKAWIIHVNADMPRISNIVTAWLSMQVATDVFITAILSITLSRAKTGYGPMDTVLRRLIRGAIQTGLFASIFSLGDLISFLTLPNTNFYGMFAIPIGRIYTNTLLDTLLVRENLRTHLSSSVYERTSRMMGWLPSRRRTFGSAATTSIRLETKPNVEEHADTSSCDASGKNLGMDIP